MSPIGIGYERNTNNQLAGSLGRVHLSERFERQIARPTMTPRSTKVVKAVTPPLRSVADGERNLALKRGAD